ncbi:MAG: hypothetical protein Q8Q35_00100 [Nanoarchaeota archaeon]|nr:hypothetical protein [Nanoarchaeota archaeon]
MVKKTLKDNVKSALIDLGKGTQDIVNTAGPYVLATVATAAGLDYAIDNIGAAVNSPQWLDTVTFYAGLGALGSFVLKPIYDDNLGTFVKSMGNVVYQNITGKKRHKFSHDTKREIKNKQKELNNNPRKRNVRTGLIAGGLAALLYNPTMRDHSAYAIGKVGGDLATITEGIEGLVSDEPTISSNSNKDYNEMFRTIAYKDPIWENRAKQLANTIQVNKNKYKTVERKTGVPWYVVGAIHMRESSGRFDTYLHNGEKLGTETKKVPKGIFFNEWNEAAMDALERQFTNNFGKYGTLEAIERYNGIGARKKTCNGQPVQSAYVWSGSNHSTVGDYVADGKFKCVEDKQVGTATILKAMVDKGYIDEVQL